MSLTLTIPVSAHDLPLLEPCVDAMAFLGGLQKHAVLFCPAPSVAAEVAVQAAKLRAVCGTVHVDALSREPEGQGRFGAFNMIFRDCVEILARRGNTNPWMWWELDVTPIRAGWADRLELEYNQKGQFFLGVRRPAADVMREANGAELPPNDPRAQGDYMVAVGIYPHNFKDISTLYKYPDPLGHMPTDVNIRHEVNRFLQHTELIGHHWSTGGYRMTYGGEIECDDYNPQPEFPRYGGTVSPMAVVVHGCKDGSLARLVQSGAGGSGTLPLHPATECSGVNPEIEALRRQNEELKAEIARLSQKTVSAEKVAEAPAKGPADDEIPANYTLPPLEKVKALLKEGGNHRLADLAADFKVPKKRFEEHILQEGSGITVLRPSTWVKLESASV